jgi:hypothetical protein
MMFTITSSVRESQVMEKVDWVLMVTFWFPESAEEESPGPETSQEETSVELHEILLWFPDCTRVGVALMETSGTRRSMAS